MQDTYAKNNMIWILRIAAQRHSLKLHFVNKKENLILEKKSACQNPVTMKITNLKNAGMSCQMFSDSYKVWQLSIKRYNTSSSLPSLNGINVLA